VPEVIAEERQQWIDINQPRTYVDDAQEDNKGGKGEQVTPAAAEDSNERKEVGRCISSNITISLLDLEQPVASLRLSPRGRQKKASSTRFDSEIDRTPIRKKSGR
jgi:hypothetical protein